jgi:hypothetical protein
LKLLFHATAGRLERSDIVLEFLAIMRSAPILPMLLRPAQHLLVRAAVDRRLAGCGRSWGSMGTACMVGKPRRSDRQGLSRTASFWNSNPAVQACRRMRLPVDYLYVQRSAVAVSSTGRFQQVT